MTPASQGDMVLTEQLKMQIWLKFDLLPSPRIGWNTKVTNVIKVFMVFLVFFLKNIWMINQFLIIIAKTNNQINLD